MAGPATVSTVLALLLVGAPSGGLAGATPGEPAVLALEITASGERAGAGGPFERTRQQRATLARSRASSDRGERSLVIDREAGRALVLFHPQKIAWTLPWPFDLERLAADTGTAPLERVEGILGDTAVEPVGTETREQVGPWPAGRHRLHAHSDPPAPRIEIDVWNADSVPFDGALFEALLASEAELDPLTRRWMPAVLALPGVPVRIRHTIATATSRRTVTLELTSVGAPDDGEPSLDVPAGYREADVDLGLLFRLP